MVGIPTDRAAHVQHQAFTERQEGSEFIGNILGRMEMSGIDRPQNVTRQSVGQVEVIGTGREAFCPNTEKFAFDCIQHVRIVEFLFQTLIQRITQAYARRHFVDRVVFVSVRNPDVVHASLVQFFPKISGNFTAAFHVLDPERLCFRVIAGQGAVRRFRMREASRVEVQPKAFFFRPFYPFFVVLRFDLVQIDFFVRIDVDGMQVDFMVAGDQAQGFVQVGTQLRRRCCFARVVAADGNPAGQGLVREHETQYIIALPALQGHFDLAQFFKHGIGIDTDCGVFLFCECVGFFDRLCHLSILQSFLRIFLGAPGLRSGLVGILRLGSVCAAIFWLPPYP